MWLIGVADQKARFLAFMALASTVKQRRVMHLINDSDSLMTLTARYDTYISRSATFLWMTTTMTDGQTDYFTPCTCARGNNLEHFAY